MHEEVEAAGDLLPDRLDRQLDAGHQHQHLEPVERVARRVGVDGRQRPVVAGVHRLQHVERLGAADLADDDPVGAHAQRVAHEVADARPRPRPRRWAGRASSETTCGCCSRSSAASSTVTMRSSAGMTADSAFSSVVLPVPVPPEMRMLSFPRTQCAQEVGRLLARACPSRQLVERERRCRRTCGSSATGRASASGGMIALTRLAVGQAGVDHRRCLVDAAADLRDDAVDDAQHVRLVEERRLRLLDLARALDVHLVEAVDHDLGHRRVVEERLDRAVAEDVVGDLAFESDAFARAERSLLDVQLFGDDLLYPCAPARRSPRGSGTRPSRAMHVRWIFVLSSAWGSGRVL